MEINEKIKNLLENEKKELNDLEKKINQPDFWTREKEPVKIQQRFARLKERIALIESADPSSVSQEIYLTGKYDRGVAILSIQAGAGGRDSEDWASLLLRMYQRYCERQNWEYRILFQTFGEPGGPEGRIGVKDVSMQIKGKFAYGLLKGEIGAHRLVRISPFSTKGLRHTSFASVEVLPKIKEDETDIIIKQDDLRIYTFCSSGHGGQNVNKRQTAVRLTHLPTGLKTACQTERTQGLNRKIATEVLLSKLFARKEAERQKELAQVKGTKVAVDFGSQIRNYVLHPYKMVKDLRTKIEVSDTEKVLDGDLDKFIQAGIAN